LKILITAGKTATALKITKAFTDDELVLADYGDMPSMHTSTYTFASLGDWNEEIIAHNLLTKALDFGVDVILPLLEVEIIAVSKSMLLFSEFGISVLLPAQVELAAQNVVTPNWIVCQDDVLLFTSLAGFSVEEKLGLNGVYWLDEQTKGLHLMHLKNY
jgi:hypothetical protein